MTEVEQQRQKKYLREVLIPESHITRAVHLTAGRVADRHRRKFGVAERLVLLGVLKSAAFFTTDLMRGVEKQGVSTQLDFVQASSYGEGTESSGEPILTWTSHPETLRNRHVLLVEDMIDTGTTLSVLIPLILDLEPSSLHVVVLLQKDKKDDVQPQFQAQVDSVFQIPDLWVDGYGIDTANKHRGLSDIWATLRTRQEQASWKEYRSRNYSIR